MAEPVPRNINELSDLAMKHSAELSAYEKEKTAKEALAIQAGTISNPTLELQGSTGGMTGSPEDHSFAIGVNQEFPLNGKLRLRHEAGLRDADVARQQQDNAARLLRQEIISLAVDFQLASKRKELALELVKLNRDLVSIAEERFKAGDIPELDLNLARVELIRADSRLLQSESELAPPRIRISALTGLDEHDIMLADTPVHKPVQPLDELTKHALATRPDMRAMSHEQ
jgi:cobalt-zinc-cadmium efflux system outer membrane protein